MTALTDDEPIGVTAPADAAGGVTSRVVKGGMWSLAGQLATTAALFVATPFVIRQLGSEAYGVLALVNLLIGYLSFADVGMGEASTRFAARAHQRGDTRNEAAVVWTTVAIAVVPTMAGAAALALGAHTLATRLFHLPPALQPAGIVAFRIAALGFVARSLAGVLNTPQLVRLRFRSLMFINSGVTVVQIVVVPIVLAAGGGLIGAVWVVTAAATAMAIGHAVVGCMLLPELARPSFDRRMVATMARFGGAVAASALMNIALASGEKLMLTWFGSVKELAHYSIAMSLAGLVSMAPTAMGQALTPAFARLGAADDRAPLQQLYTRALRATLFWSAPVTLALCLIARPFFTRWAGPEFGDDSTGPFYVLAAGLLLNIVACIPYRLLLAQGRADVLARYHAFELVPYVVGAALLTHWFGAVGAAAAWTLRQVVAAAVLLIAVIRTEGLAPAAIPSHRVSFAAAVAVLAGPMVLAIAVVPSIAGRLLIGIASIGVYLAVVWGRVLTDAERCWLQQMLRSHGLLPAYAGNRVAP
jgi:O-antigen/teichoic acid export membrane protein